MNLSNKGFSTNKSPKLNSLNRTTTLNPNAAEFVPSALRSPAGNTNFIDGPRNDVTVRNDVSGTSGKAIFNRSESSMSNNSDDEVHQYWRKQLPDDITPDFKVSADDAQGTGNLTLVGLSIHDNLETSRSSVMAGSIHRLSKRPELSSFHNEDTMLSEKMRYSVPTIGEDQSVDSFLDLPTNLWDKQFMNGDKLFTIGRDRHPFNGDSSADLFNDLLGDNTILDGSEIRPVEFLASQFPGFAAESLAEVYYANECDLNLTIEMLTQLELQVDGGFNQNLTTKTQSAPNLTPLDFPALATSESQNGLTKFTGDSFQQASNPYLSVNKDSHLLFKSNSSAVSRGVTDFASAVRKIASQDSGQWKFDRNGSHDISAGSSRNSRVGLSKSIYADRLQSHGSRAAPVWVETGEAVANMYSELREEARDHARLRNVYFEQARQAYLIGNKALAKELSVKGHLHNMRMKSAHGKAKESIYRQRNPVAPELQTYSRGQDPMIDLHGLHVSEAIHMLKHELSILRITVRATAQPLPVLICVGTGHHTKGSRTPARLPVAVERFLLEEGLEYTEPQPGLLRIVLY